jgi:hypothetical protein
MEERDHTYEDDDGGRRGTFTTGLQRRGGCANPSQNGLSRERDAAEEEKTRSGWRSSRRRSPVPAKTTMRGGEGSAAARWVRENPSEVKKLSPEAN